MLSAYHLPHGIQSKITSFQRENANDALTWIFGQKSSKTDRLILHFPKMELI